MKGPTLTIIKSEHDKVFGGFTKQSWAHPKIVKDNEDSQYGQVDYPIPDRDAFLFSVDHQSFHLNSAKQTE